MLLKSIDIYVYKLDNDGGFDAIGQVNRYTSIIWPTRYNGYSSFELNAPVTPENKTLLKKGNIIWCGGDNACVIEIIQSDTNDKGQKVYKIKGRSLEVLLKSRIIWDTYYCVEKHSSTAIYEIVKSQCISPNDSLRKIPFLTCADDEMFGKIISFQKTGGEVYSTIEEIANDSELGFDILFRPKNKSLIFKVTEGIDRTLESSIRISDAVIFSTDLEDILSSSYYTNDEDVKTVALVAGEGEGSERVRIVAGNNASVGFQRKELYVDAKDLQSEIQKTTVEEDGRETTETVTIHPDEYRDMLNDRGMMKLAEHITNESFEAEMRIVGNVQYVYGVDYNKGDKVTIQDTELGVQVNARITEVSENFDDEYELIITFGYEPPTLIKKIKQQVMN